MRTPADAHDLAPHPQQRLLERLVFGHRPALVALLAALSLLLGWQALKLEPKAGYRAMIPAAHPYVQTLRRHLTDLGAADTTLLVVVENGAGDIFQPAYLRALRKLGDDLHLLHGVDGDSLRSLWTPEVRWSERTAAGPEGGPLMPADWNGSRRSSAALRENLRRSDHPGVLVADDQRSSIVELRLFDRDPLSGKRLDYRALARQLEDEIRARHERDPIRLHFAGFAPLAGEMIEGVAAMRGFALLAVALCTLLLFLRTRCLALTLVTVGCSLLAAGWQLGLMKLLGIGLDAWTALLPFLVFALGLGHGLHVVGAIGEETRAGRGRLLAAKHAFRQAGAAALPGLAAALAAFLCLAAGDFELLRETGMAAALGIAALLPANLVLLPVLLSYFGICLRGRQRLQRQADEPPPIWQALAFAATTRAAALSLLLALVALGWAALQLGELRVGEPPEGPAELRAPARSSEAARFVAEHYRRSPSTLVVLAEMSPGSCFQYRNLERIDRFAGTMRRVAGVESVESLAEVARQAVPAGAAAEAASAPLTDDQAALDRSFAEVPPQLVSGDCSLAPVALGLADRTDATLRRVVGEVERFAAANDDAGLRFTLAAGDAGLEAAANQALAQAGLRLPLLLAAALAFVLLAWLRSIGAMLCVLLPVLCGLLLGGAA